jgi:ABC-type Fe3+/spermidine/putrescine transport system ATPase subunit
MTKIVVANVSRDYAGTRAVADVSFSVEAGEFVTLLGPSGSGKTTTLRMIAGLDRPTAGTISIDGAVVSSPQMSLAPHERDIGMVFQGYAVWPHMTVFDNVAFPLRRRKFARAEMPERVSDILRQVGLSGLEHRYPSQLSGGQQQRVALARALVGQPKVVLFDEPLSNLDAKLRDSVRDLLQSLHRRLGLTVIYVTHDQGEAMILSDRIYVMNGGRIVQAGSAQNIYERPESIFVADFVGRTNIIPIVALDVVKRTALLAGDVSVAFETPPSAFERTGEPQLLVRPHCVHVWADRAAAGERPNLLDAIVREISYLGDRQRYVLEVPPGLMIAAEVVAGRDLPLPGARVVAELPPGSCVIV